MYSKYGKRLLDITVAGSGLLLSAPLLLALVPLLYVVNDGGVFFRQQRPGLHGRLFYLYKLQTMTTACTATGWPLPDAQRLTRLGRWLRRLSIDELPQLYNVLRGDLSLVGPRPLLPQYLPLYSPEQARRHRVQPGITGWAQVQGRNNLSWEQKFGYDLWYTDNVSFKTDLRILLKTLKIVWRGNGIHTPGYATAPEFTGSRTEI
ncbi:sugar transferase [Pontibacter sp. 172403-2]|uniref:sugar transferase n=1 Tax=Pontibacter rufus TaxID=2791028 RepID=UPI0018B0009D|nr:sugar transferase [Pontibacter sp. 172403-2]MBF9252393.1 sugar transferase [Pontibacter sp. 172403-2]